MVALVGVFNDFEIHNVMIALKIYTDYFTSNHGFGFVAITENEQCCFFLIFVDKDRKAVMWYNIL